MKIISALFLLLILSLPALAVEPDEMLKDPALEARARAITHNLRCLVCQGEAVDESQAPLAADLRKLVRERLLAGDSEKTIETYLRARYGDYVLMTPPFSPTTGLLWAAPLVVLLLGTGIAFFFIRRAGKEG
ncbi:MAG: cytochrome c-type biogenesis protein [Alphaproteobacteria bacterium]